MQPKGTLDFNPNLETPTKKVQEEKKKELLKKVFKVNPSNAPVVQTPPEPETEQRTKDITDKSEEEIQVEAQAEGHKDFIKEAAKEEEKNSQKLNALTQSADIVLFQTKTANPLEIFASQIIIDTNKTSVIHKEFFGTERVHSVMIKDVSDVFIDTTPFFAKLTIVDRGFTENEVTVEFLKKDEAKKARRIIQGLVIALEQDLDFAKLREEMSPEEISDKIEKIGIARIGDGQTKST